jgi:hypothetical protein
MQDRQVRAQQMKHQEPLTVYSYWSAPDPGKPHIGYAIRKRMLAPAMVGLALSGGIFGLFATFGMNPSTLSFAALSVTLPHLLRTNEGGWYAVDNYGVAVEYLGHRPPEHIRGRAGVPLEIFLRQVRTLS